MVVNVVDRSIGGWEREEASGDFSVLVLKTRLLAGFGGRRYPQVDQSQI